MICPHCKKPLKRGASPEIIRRAKEMVADGYSLRDISRLLEDDGIFISFATLSRHLSGKTKARSSEGVKNG